MDFRCVEECSDCCVQREYYPTKQFGKIGVLILPNEKEKIEKFAKENKIKIKILPRIGVSEKPTQIPTKILAYQLMGIEENGNTCPFLDTESGGKSTHGGYPCKIYKSKPLACSAYPLIELNPITLDEKCKFCKECGTHLTCLLDEYPKYVYITICSLDKPQDFKPQGDIYIEDMLDWVKR